MAESKSSLQAYIDKHLHWRSTDATVLEEPIGVITAQNLTGKIVVPKGVDIKFDSCNIQKADFVGQNTCYFYNCVIKDLTAGEDCIFNFNSLVSLENLTVAKTKCEFKDCKSLLKSFNISNSSTIRLSGCKESNLSFNIGDSTIDFHNCEFSSDDTLFTLNNSNCTIFAPNTIGANNLIFNAINSNIKISGQQELRAQNIAVFNGCRLDFVDCLFDDAQVAIDMTGSYLEMDSCSFDVSDYAIKATNSKISSTKTGRIDSQNVGIQLTSCSMNMYDCAGMDVIETALSASANSIVYLTNMGQINHQNDSAILIDSSKLFFHNNTNCLITTLHTGITGTNSTFEIDNISISSQQNGIILTDCLWSSKNVTSIDTQQTGVQISGGTTYFNNLGSITAQQTGIDASNAVLYILTGTLVQGQQTGINFNGGTLSIENLATIQGNPPLNITSATVNFKNINLIGGENSVISNSTVVYDNVPDASRTDTSNTNFTCIHSGITFLTGSNGNLNISAASTIWSLTWTTGEVDLKNSTFGDATLTASSIDVFRSSFSSNVTTNNCYGNIINSPITGNVSETNSVLKLIKENISGNLIAIGSVLEVYEVLVSGTYNHNDGELFGGKLVANEVSQNGTNSIIVHLESNSSSTLVGGSRIITDNFAIAGAATLDAASLLANNFSAGANISFTGSTVIYNAMGAAQTVSMSNSAFLGVNFDTFDDVTIDNCQYIGVMGDIHGDLTATRSVLDAGGMQLHANVDLSQQSYLSLVNFLIAGNVSLASSSVLSMDIGQITGALTISESILKGSKLNVTGNVTATQSSSISLANFVISGDLSLSNLSTLIANGISIGGNVTLSSVSELFSMLFNTGGNVSLALSGFIAHDFVMEGSFSASNLSYAYVNNFDDGGTTNKVTIDTSILRSDFFNSGDLTIKGGSTVALSQINIIGDGSIAGGSVLDIKNGTLTGNVTVTGASSLGLFQATITKDLTLNTGNNIIAQNLAIQGNTALINWDVIAGNMLHFNTLDFKKNSVCSGNNVNVSSTITSDSGVIHGNLWLVGGNLTLSDATDLVVSRSAFLGKLTMSKSYGLVCDLNIEGDTTSISEGGILACCFNPKGGLTLTSGACIVDSGGATYSGNRMNPNWSFLTP